MTAPKPYRTDIPCPRCGRNLRLEFTGATDPDNGDEATRAYCEAGCDEYRTVDDD